MRDHWTLETIDWLKFDRSKLNPELVRLVKAASLVEYNARDYVEYLRVVFKNEPKMMEVLERWGTEEVQHGSALAKWAEMADPTFNFEQSFARFRKGYRPDHFINADGSVRGSRIGELIARCVVECGTSSSYTALRDAADEPVLKQVASLIAADEFKHYRLFYDLMDAQPEQKPGLLRRMYIAATRMSESTDDELAYAYYSANFPEGAHYDRKACNAAYQSSMMLLYKRPHIESAIGMVGRAIGIHPESRFLKWTAGALWNFISWRWTKPLPA
jgi:rubrerythrin